MRLAIRDKKGASKWMIVTIIAFILALAVGGLFLFFLGDKVAPQLKAAIPSTCGAPLYEGICKCQMADKKCPPATEFEMKGSPTCPNENVYPYDKCKTKEAFDKTVKEAKSADQMKGTCCILKSKIGG